MNIELSCRWGRPRITGRAKGIFMRQSWIYRCKDHFAVFPRFRLEFSRSQPFPKWSCIKTAPTLREAKTTTSVGYSPERPQDAGRSFPLGQKGRSEQYCRGLRSHVEGRRSEGFPRQFHIMRPATGMAVAHQASRFCDDSPCPREATYLLRCKVSGDMRRVVSLTSNSRRGMLFKHHAFECR